MEMLYKTSDIYYERTKYSQNKQSEIKSNVRSLSNNGLFIPRSRILTIRFAST